MLQSMGSQRVGHKNWTPMNKIGYSGKLLIFCYCCNTFPNTWRLKTTQIYYITILQFRYLTWILLVQKKCLLSPGSSGGEFFFLPFGFWRQLTFLCMWPAPSSFTFNSETLNFLTIFSIAAFSCDHIQEQFSNMWGQFLLCVWDSPSHSRWLSLTSTG